MRSSPASRCPAPSATSRPAGPTPPARRRPTRQPGQRPAPPAARTRPDRNPAAPSAPRRSPAPLHTPVTQRDLEAEVASCVGGVGSPILSNIYLDRLDKFAGTVLIPEYTRGIIRVANPEYARLTRAISDAWRQGDRAAVRRLRAAARDPARGPGRSRLPEAEIYPVRR